MTEGGVETDEIASKLAEGLLALYEPDLKRVRQQLQELTKKQTNLIDQLHEENAKLTAVQTSEDLQEMFATVKLYQTKLLSIKKEMATLHDRATKIKKRALKLQQAKQKAALQRESQIQKEADLIAKPQSSSSSHPT